MKTTKVQFVIIEKEQQIGVSANDFIQWLKENAGRYATGLEMVKYSKDKVSTGLSYSPDAMNQSKPFVVLYYKGGNMMAKEVIKECYASWDEAINRHVQLKEHGYFLPKQNAA